MAQIGMIYIGQFAPADTDETNWAAENPNLFLGTYSKSSLKPLTTTVATPLDDGIAYDDDKDKAARQITYTLGTALSPARKKRLKCISPPSRWAMERWSRPRSM